MKICLVSDSYYPHPGGVTEHVHHLAVGLRDRGHEVKILTARYPDHLDGSDPEVHRVGRSILIPVNESYATITVGFSVLSEVRDFLRDHEFDVVHTHGPLAPTLPMLALWYSRSANVATFHAARDTTPAYALFSPVLRGFFRRVHAAVAVSEVARRSIARYFPGEYTIVPNGVDPQRFNPQVEPVADFADGRPNLLFVGRFDPRKGLRYLLAAMPAVLQAVPEARLIVVGDGRARPRLEDMVPAAVKPSVEFVGRVSTEMMPRYYSSAEIYCSPATGRESFGITLLEAMASGAAVVAFDNPGYRGVLTHEEDGLLVPNRDPVALASTLIDLLQDPARRRRLRDKALATADLYDWSRVSTRVEALYESAMRRAGRVGSGPRRTGE